jgi:hypothetical protein
MSIIIRIDDFLGVAKKDHALLDATKLVSTFSIRERVGHQSWYIGNSYLFGGYNTCYIGNNRNPITRVHWILEPMMLPWMYLVICHDQFPSFDVVFLSSQSSILLLISLN